MGVLQTDRIIKIATPLGDDFLLVEHLEATEGISQLFSVRVELLHLEPNEATRPTAIAPTDILGRQVSISVTLPDGTERYFSGIVNRFSQGVRNPRYSFYEATIVPHVWALTQKKQSRIFQQKSVPDILREVFAGLDVRYEIQGTFHQRNYCVQYRETDFDFASRLMEEEGIFYFFTHSNGSHQMVVANSTGSHPDCSKSNIPFYDIIEGEEFVSAIQKFDYDNVYHTGKVTFWDYNFQLGTKRLEAEKITSFVVGDNTKFEVYDNPGGYAKRYDGIDKSGGEQPGELMKIYEDNVRRATTENQMYDGRYRNAYGTSNCSALVAGHRFTLVNYPNPEINGPYVLTQVSHQVKQSPSYLSDNFLDQPYQNQFECMPIKEGVPPFRPLHATPRPFVHGSQTAVVVGPAGEEIFTDKYGRVKVQFHWDRQGRNNEASSCWVRVAQAWAGNNWGTFFLPRIGMEVVVDFIEGDPDQPIITGCVYNPAAMPPYTLPNEKTRSVVKTNSSMGGGGFNELRFEDKKGSEQIFIHAEKNEDIRVKNDCFETIGRDRQLVVGRDQIEDVKGDKHLTVKGKRIEAVKQSLSLNVGGSRDEKISMKHATEAGMEIHLKAGMKVVIEAGAQLTLKGPGGFVDISPAGVTVQGTMVLINSGGAAGAGSGSNPEDPKGALEADRADAGKRIAAPSPPPRFKPEQLSPLGSAFINAQKSGTPFVGLN